jgi:hypothetical protein
MSIIRTRYRPATDYRGSRIKASIGPDAVTVPYDHRLSGSGNHKTAAHALATKLGLEGHWALYSDHATGDGYVFVNLDAADHNRGFDITN